VLLRRRSKDDQQADRRRRSRPPRSHRALHDGDRGAHRGGVAGASLVNLGRVARGHESAGRITHSAARRWWPTLASLVKVAKVIAPPRRPTTYAASGRPRHQQADVDLRRHGGVHQQPLPAVDAHPVVRVESPQSSELLRLAAVGEPRRRHPERRRWRSLTLRPGVGDELLAGPRLGEARRTRVGVQTAHAGVLSARAGVLSAPCVFKSRRWVGRS
jgi:hypothetical protein